MANGVLIHVRVPAEILEEIDELASGGTRGAVITEALRAYLRRARQLQAVRTGAGLLAKDPGPHWLTKEDADAWVRSLRADWNRSD